MLTVAFSRLCVLMFSLLLALAGCEESAYRSKPGATTADLKRDLADCERVATGPTPFHFWALGVSQSRWRTLGSMALAAAAVGVIGFTTVAPAKADYDDWRWRRNWHERVWRERDWREHHRHAYGYFYSYPSYSYPSYGYSYPYGGYSYDYYR